ncbi:hypothetical protein EIP86_001483 [Pleurotus ostreatoroseus]|nr:hypothetical protein EIP86_001483 [Pleurotus ostreatoroseus]
MPVLHDLTYPFPSLSSPSSSATLAPKTGYREYTTRFENPTMTSVRGRKSANGASEPTNSSVDPTPSTSSSALSGLLTATSSAAEREEVKVNNASVTEMKHACDDALKRFLSRPELFKQIYTHTDVRLGLGWASVFVAAGTGLYGWKIDFEKSKPVVWAGLILYILLTTLQALYAYFIEGDIVFVGKRKTFDKRVERLTISSTNVPSRTTPPSPPAYSLTLSFVRSTSGGKSLLSKGRATQQKSYTAFFDENGVLDQDIFESWLGRVVRDVMEDDRTKAE